MMMMMKALKISLSQTKPLDSVKMSKMLTNNKNKKKRIFWQKHSLN